MFLNAKFLSLVFTSWSLLSIFPVISQDLVLQRKAEPNEKAFSLLVPKDWKMEGGIFRIDPSAGGGAGNAIAAKCDLALYNNSKKSVMIRWLPDMLYFDMSTSPAAGLYPMGSNYNGMMVIPKLNPEQFIINVVIPYAHPGAQNVQIINSKILKDLQARYQNYARQILPGLTMYYSAALIELSYSENGIQYLEKIVTVIEDYGQMGAGLWGNKETFLIKTPIHEFENWAPVFSIIQNSVEFSTQWLTGEIKGQLTRAKIMQDVQRQVQDIDQAIVEHRQNTNAEIHNDMFLTLTDQEEYVNPFTQKTEMGSNQWKYRWTNDLGDIIYSDREDYDPNTDLNLNIQGFKKTPVRKRKPE